MNWSISAVARHAYIFHDKRMLRVAFGHTFACDVCKELTDGCCLSLSAVVVVLFVVVVH